MPESRDSYYKRTYDRTLEDYEIQLASQGYVCGICGGVNRTATGEEKHLVWDHNHLTGHTRGLLCDACNRGLGCFKDTKGKAQELLIRALSYLRSYDGSDIPYTPDCQPGGPLPGPFDSLPVPEVSQSSSHCEQTEQNPQDPIGALDVNRTGETPKQDLGDVENTNVHESRNR